MFREKLYLPSTNPSSNQIWTTEIYYTINQKKNFQRKVEKVQHKACLATTDLIQGTSKQKKEGQLGLQFISKEGGVRS